MIKAGLKKASIKKIKSFRAKHSECFNFWMTAVSVPQALKTDKAVIKTSLKPKNDTEKSDFISMLSDLFFKTVVKCICQNYASAKGGFAEWLRVPDCKLHRLMLWNSEENVKGQGSQRRLFKRDIFFMIKILRGNIKSKVKLLMSLIKIKKHYFSAYVICQILMSVTNVEISFVNWDILFKLTISKHRNGIWYDL